jgi:hypothetical protein
MPTASCGAAPSTSTPAASARSSNSPRAASWLRCVARTGPCSRLSFVEGRRVRSERLYDNGRPESQDEIASGLRTERRFSPDGVKRYELVSLVGARAFKQRELEYSDRGTLVRERAWNDDGTPGRDDEVFEDGSRKVFAK